ncbi:hypothetical protein [Pseudoalteromonas sp.]|uniref:hypothetical protein n=1 Tax=Pseudoalteromonas sp. TaxID=53249 RepID=UPI00257C96C4|nr:hypothetical protein [Pseudoalteromonas sp.]
MSQDTQELLASIATLTEHNQNLLEQISELAKTSEQQSEDVQATIDNLKTVAPAITTINEHSRRLLNVVTDHYSADNTKLRNDRIYSEVREATKQGIDTTALDTVKTTIQKDLKDVAKDLETEVTNFTKAVEKAHTDVVTTAEASKQNMVEMQQEYDNGTMSLTKRYTFILTPIILLGVIVIWVTVWLAKPDPKDVGELKSEIRALELQKAQQLSDLRTDKQRYDNAMMNSNTMMLNGEMHLLVDTKRCEDSDKRKGIEYCRIVGGMPMPKAVAPRGQSNNRTQYPASPISKPCNDPNPFNC